MLIDIITLFPKMFEGPLTESIISRAQKKGLVKIKTHQLRDWAINNHGQVDDRPYGGGSGMLLRIDVAYAALQSLSQKNPKSQTPNPKQISNSKSKLEKLTKLKANEANPYIILPTPSGKKFDQALARKLAKKKHLVFLCPHYEGYDKRIESLVDEKISIGDYVLTGGEIPAMAIVDSVVRLLPGVIKKESLEEESFNAKFQMPNIKSMSKSKCQNTENCELKIENCFEYPQYTRPEIFEVTVKDAIHPRRTRKIKKRVPKVLLSGNHAEIKKWRNNKAL